MYGSKNMKINDIVTINTSLNSNFWENNQLLAQIERRLTVIANDFFESLGLEGVNLEDITFTGSLANYNWTKFSDVDLHLIVNFEEVDENIDLVREYFSAKTSGWNKSHNISIFGHDVELYVQNSTEKHFSTGVYSILNGQWLTKPVRKEPKVSTDTVKTKIDSFVDMIERAEDLFDDNNFEEAHKFSLKLIKKIKNFRQSGLEERGEFSNENLTFKYLRNNEFIKNLHDVRNDSYDKMMSLEGDFEKKFKIFVASDLDEELTGFHKLEEIEKFQKRVKKRHARMKRRLLRLGKQKNTPPYVRRVTFKRGKSAPAGFGGA